MQNCPLVLSMSQTIWNQILSSSMTCTVYQTSLSCLCCLTCKGVAIQPDSWGLYEHSIASISKILRTVRAPYMCLLNKYACSSWLPPIPSHLSRRNALFPDLGFSMPLTFSGTLLASWNTSQISKWTGHHILVI